MPKKYTKTKTKTKTKPKTVVVRRKKMSIGYTPRILPEKFVNRMTAATTIDMDCSSTGVSFYYTRANSVYDVFGAESSRNASGYSLMHNVFTRSIVLGSKITITCLTPYSDTNPMMAVINLQPGTTADTNIDELGDFYESRRKISPVKMFGNYITKNFSGQNAISGVFSAKKFFGKSPIGDLEKAAGDSEHPTDQANYGIYLISPGTPSGAVDPPPMRFLIKVDYVVYWFQPKTVDND